MRVFNSSKLAGTASSIFACGLVLGLSFPLLCQAKEVRYKDYPLELRENDRLVLIGLKGSVHLAPAVSAQGGLMRVRKLISDRASGADLAAFDAMSFNVRREGAELIIEQKSSVEKDKLQLDAASVKGHPELDYEILAPAVPMELAVRDAQIQIRDWKQSLAIELVSGQLTTAGTEGSMRVQIQRGEVHVAQHKGRLEIDSYAAKVTAREVEGDIDLENFSGETTLSDVTGAMDVRSQGGPVVISKSSGALDFLTGHGSLTLASFAGPVRGQVDQGSVTASLEGEAEVHIEAGQGSVNVKLPADSGASLRLQTEEGSLLAPDSIKATPHGKTLVGRLKGEGPKGTVAVKSKSGSVHIRL